jgi:DHA2 family multidrug resistance protein-like MFS transporter
MATSIPADVTPEAAAVARDTIGGAVEVATHLPAAASDALLRAADAAFIDLMQISATISVAGALILAGFVFVTLRHVESMPEPEAEDEADIESGTDRLVLAEPA